MMKKLFLFLALAIGFSACDGKDGRDGRDGIDGEDIGWHAEWIKVQDKDWKLSGKPNEIGSYFYFDHPVPKLTEEVYDHGSLTAYLELQELESKVSLPYSDFYLNPENEKEWTYRYDVQFELGYVRFVVKYSDYLTSERPGGEQFHIVMLW